MSARQDARAQKALAFTNSERNRRNRILLALGQRICKQCGQQRSLEHFYSGFNEVVGKTYYASCCSDCENGATVLRRSGRTRLIDPQGHMHCFVDLLPSDVGILQAAGWQKGNEL